MLGILFPGQGSQAPGMGQFLVENFKEAEQCFEEASDVLAQDFKKLCFDGSAEELGLTENTQPALLTVSVATLRSLQTMIELPVKAYAGHSVGEYAALVAAQAIPFADAVRAVRTRGKAMQSAVPVGKGAMAAIMGPTSEEVREACQWVEEESGQSPVTPANYNSVDQTVVSGSKEAVDWMVENIKTREFASAPRRVKAIPLKVSAPFHCAMMQPAEDAMAVELNDIALQDIETPVVQNFVAAPVTAAEELRTNLVQQVTGSVRWVESLQKFKDLGTSKFIECGVGKVLAGLNKKFDAGFETFGTNSLEDLKAIEAALKS